MNENSACGELTQLVQEEENEEPLSRGGEATPPSTPARPNRKPKEERETHSSHSLQQVMWETKDSSVQASSVVSKGSSSQATTSQGSMSGRIANTSSYTGNQSRLMYLNEKERSKSLRPELPRVSKQLKVRTAPCKHHSFLSEVPDVRHMEQALLQLLEDFHSGNLRAFGKDCSMEQMTEIREQQEKLAKLHFEMGQRQDHGADQSGFRQSNANMHNLLQRLEQLSVNLSFSGSKLLLNMSRRNNQWSIEFLEWNSPKKMVFYLRRDTALYLTEFSHKSRIMRYLIKAGGNVNLSNKKKIALFTCIFKCLQYKVPKPAMIESMLGTYTYESFRNKGPDLLQSFQLNCHEVANILKKIVASTVEIEDIAEKLIEYKCPFFMVVVANEFRLTKAMLDRGARINQVDPKTKETALHVAICLRNFNTIRLLLDYGADVHARDAKRNPPLYYYGEVPSDINQHRDILKTFLDQGAYDYQEGVDEMPLGRALRLGNRKTLALIFKYCDDFQKKDRHGMTMLHYLAANIDEEVVEELLYKNINVKVTNNNRETPLHLSMNNPKLTKMFIEKGADVNARTYDKKTPLMYALRPPLYRKTETSIKMLLRNKADPLAKTYDGRTVFEKSCLDLQLPMMAHALMLEALGWRLEQRVVRLMNRNSSWKGLYEVLKEQLQRMRRYKVHGSVSLFDLLTCSDREFRRLVAQPELLDNLEYARQTCIQFRLRTYYCETISTRLEFIYEVNRCKQNAAQFLFEHTGLSIHGHYFIVNQILSYLSLEDLRKF